MNVFVTGGSGFIGRRLVRLLVENGHAVTALARSRESATTLAALGATPARGDLANTAALRAAMTGRDVVFHLAGWTRIGARDSADAWSTNVDGTRTVLALAHQLGVPRIIYTSAVNVFGDTGGRLVDETFVADRPLPTIFARTKWHAHYQVALPLQQQGAPIIITMPGVVYGPANPHLIGDLMHRFLTRELPWVPGPSTIQTYVHVDDVVRGHLLLAEQGEPGETYVMTGPPVPLADMVVFWSHLTGVRPPLLALPATLLNAVARPLGALSRALRLAPFFSGEMAAMAGGTYIARSDRLQARFDWHPRPLQQGMVETFTWLTRHAPVNPNLLHAQQRMLVAAGCLLLLTALAANRKG